MIDNACRIVPQGPHDVRLRTRHVVSPDTAKAVLERRNGHTLRWLATTLHYPESFATTLSHISRQTPGCICLAGENMLRRHLNLPPVAASAPPPHVIHTDEEHATALARLRTLMDDATPGLPDEDELELLAVLIDRYERKRWPDEVSTPKYTRKPYYRPCLPMDKAERLAALRALAAVLEAQQEEAHNG